jgi:NTP pyrophosphatase (non-canonical NTP hydrolase)
MEEDLSILQLIEQAHATAKEKGWWEDPNSPDNHIGMKLMLMVSELAEGLEEYRSGRALDEIWYQTDGKPEGIPVELADVIIRIADLCGYHKIPLMRAILQKLAYNKTRPHRHGNKKA